MDLYFSREIRNRIQVIRDQQDSLHISPLQIDRDVNNLLLMTRDVENLVAAINKANAYFSMLAKQQQLNAAGFAPLNTGMTLNDMASLLKENELNFFNQVIFKIKISPGTAIYTAH